MNIKSLLFMVVFGVHYTHCLSEKGLNMIVLGVGSVFVIDNLVDKLPEFWKNDKHKKLHRESMWMAAKVCASAWYLNKTLNFWNKFTNPIYVMGSTDNEEFVKMITPYCTKTFIQVMNQETTDAVANYVLKGVLSFFK